MIAGGDQQHGGGVGPTPYSASSPGAAGHQRDDQLIEALELAAEELGAPPAAAPDCRIPRRRRAVIAAARSP
jgi:hypothetical protein